jgi:hypothetical protein
MCGKSRGTVKPDGLNAIISGDCVVIGFSNPSLHNAIMNQPQKKGIGKDFVAFVIPKECPTVKHV